YVQEIFAEAKGVRIRLRIDPQKGPVIHGKSGVSQKGEGRGRASHYYSFSRLAARGEVRAGGRTVRVRGSAWMDHEFGSNQLAPGLAGWDWLGLQLSDGRELMLYLMRTKSGGLDPNSSGTLIEPDGRAIHLPLGRYLFRGTGRWRSPESGAVYPMGWRVRAPGAGIDLRLTPLAEGQEMRTKGSARVIYWEGAVSAEGVSAGQKVRGAGFVEMTGYAEGGRPDF
ncbi:MAG: lipocalin family protein, partial [bacterium]